MQNQAIIAGLRALVEQIDHLERRNGTSSASTAGYAASNFADVRRPQPALRNIAQISSAMSISASSDRVSTSAPSLQAAPIARRAAAAPVQSKASVIAQRLGVSSRNFFQVAHAVGRDSCMAH